MNDIFDAVDHLLNVHYKYATKTDVKPLMNDWQKSVCLADIVFSSLFFSDYRKNFGVDEFDIIFLSEKVPTLAARACTGFYRFGDMESAANLSATIGRAVHTDKDVLAYEKRAVTELCEEIQTNAEVAAVCWKLAEKIAAADWWKMEDAARDCMVQVGILPLYDGFEGVYC